MSRGLNLNTHVYFEAVARRGTITRAAEELAVSPSAVSQQVKLLELQLGIKLFRREGRTLSLTLEGEQLYRASSGALRILRDAERNLGSTRQRNRLNLRVTPSFGVRWLGPRLSDYIAVHPDWDVRVDAAPDPTDFAREVMDLDIRYGTAEQGLYHHQPVVMDHVLPLSSPDYLARLPSMSDPAERLYGARLIDSARALCQWDTWLLHFGLEVAGNRKSILMDRSSMALQLALDGAGVVLESLALAADEVATGRLVPVTPTLPALAFRAYWAICPERNLKRRGVRQFLEWLDGQASLHHQKVADLLDANQLSVEEIDPAAVA